MEQMLRGSFGSSQRILLLAIKLSKKQGSAKKYGFLVPVTTAPLLRHARQYSAIRSIGPVRAPLLRVVSNATLESRGIAMFVVKAVKGVLKIRYLVLGGAISGGMTLQKTYDEWMESFREFEWMKKYLPDREHFEEARNTFLSLKENVKIDPRVTQLFETKLNNFRNRLSERWEEALQAAEQAKSESKGFGGFLGDFIQDLSPSVKMNAVDAYDDRRKSESIGQERLDNLQNELMTMQLKYQKELEKLERENKELRKQLYLRGNVIASKKIKKSLIDMYSEVLDELSDYDVSYRAQDHLPRVVVVGDQSSGKTSVLEMVAQARIFPRGAGEMMTRAPVKVTLSEGPYHIAQFKDSAREFDLSKESELAELRTEVELRMKNSVAGGKTVSDSVISMTVKGPGLQRMVLVDLPGIISTVTMDMANDTRESIRYMTQTYMSNPNAIILCIQDGSVDAERSNVTDLVAQMDPQGKRTIFVLTKVDMAEENLADPTRIQKILSGKLFPMKALGYFAVVTGRGRQDDSIQTIKEYEERFFRNSKLFKGGLISTSQVTTRNLSLAVSECFWKMVRETVDQQADHFKATRFNLETEWKNSFPRIRELDRDELFEKARGEVLDDLAALSQIPAHHWEQLLMKKLWENVSGHIFESVYLAAAQIGSTPSGHSTFKTFVDIQLKRWADQQLPFKSVECGWQALKDEFEGFIAKERAQKDHDIVFDKLKDAVVDEAMTRHTWEDKGSEMLRVIQLNALEDENIPDKAQWDAAIEFLKTSLTSELATSQNVINEMFGPGAWERWTRWKYTTEDQYKRCTVKVQLDKILKNEAKHAATLSPDELTAIRKNLQQIKIDVDNEYVRSTWGPLFRRHFLQQSLAKAYDCRKMYHLYRQGLQSEVDCNDVVLFWRVQQVLKVTANALRQQIQNREARRLEKEVRDVLEDYSQDNEKKKTLLRGRRVTLAEELKKVRQIQERLEDFIQALNKEK